MHRRTLGQAIAEHDIAGYDGAHKEENVDGHTKGMRRMDFVRYDSVALPDLFKLLCVLVRCDRLVGRPNGIELRGAKFAPFDEHFWCVEWI